VIPEPSSDRSDRAATTDDLDDIVALFHASDARVADEPESMREYLTWIWGLPTFDLGRDSLLLPGTEGLDAFAQFVWDAQTGGPARLDWAVHPRHDLDSIALTLLDWGEEQRRGRGVTDPLRTNIMSADEAAAAMLERRGFTQVRTSWDMTRALLPGDRMFEPTPGVTVRTFRAGEELVLHEVADTSFRDHWDHVDTSFETFTATMLATPWEPELTFFAEVDGRVAGELIALAFDDRAYVASVGVLREFRQRGAATSLLRRAFAALAERGLTRVELSVDAASPTGAVSLYEGLGMRSVRSYATFDGPSAA
jgi:mycothiol synthase